LGDKLIIGVSSQIICGRTLDEFFSKRAYSNVSRINTITSVNKFVFGIKWQLLQVPKKVRADLSCWFFTSNVLADIACFGWKCAQLCGQCNENMLLMVLRLISFGQLFFVDSLSSSSDSESSSDDEAAATLRLLRIAIVEEFLDEESDSEQDKPRRGRKRALCWLRSHFADLDDKQFKTHFRISRGCFEWLHEMICPLILHLRCLNSVKECGFADLRSFAQEAVDTSVFRRPAETGRAWAFSTQEELAILLLFLSTGSSEAVIDRQVGASPTSIWRIIRRVSTALVVIGKPKFLGWPTSASEWHECALGFFAASRGLMNGAVGAIDNTHIDVKLPLRERDASIDRTGSWTIHIQAVCTAGWRILSWRVGDVGSRQDSGVLQASCLWQAQEAGRPFIPTGCFLIGDAGFPCRPWLLVPWSKRNNGELDARKLQFNKVFCGQRVVIEQLFGIMKSKWQILCRVRQYANFHSPESMRLFATCTAVLHNAALEFGDLTPSKLFVKAEQIRGLSFYSTRKILVERTVQDQDKARAELVGKGSWHRDHTKAGFAILQSLMDRVLENFNQ